MINIWARARAFAASQWSLHVYTLANVVGLRLNLRWCSTRQWPIGKRARLALAFLLDFRGSSRGLSWCFWALDSQVDIDGERQHYDSDTPVLQLVKVCVEEVHIEDKLVDHLQVAENLQLARSLILEGKKLERLGTYHTERHTEEHHPVDGWEHAWVVKEGLVKHDHGCCHEDRLHDVCPGCQCLRTRLLHLS